MSDTKKKARIGWHAATSSTIEISVPKHVNITLGGHFASPQPFDLSTANTASLQHLLVGAIGTLIVNTINSARAKGDNTPASVLRDATWARVQSGEYPGRRGGGNANMPTEEAFRANWLKATAISLMNAQGIAADKLEAVISKIRVNDSIVARLNAAWEVEAERQQTILEASEGLDLSGL